MLYMSMPELIHLISGSLYLLASTPISPTPQPLATAFLYSVPMSPVIFGYMYNAINGQR